MRIKRRLFIIGSLLAACLLIYIAFLLLVYGIRTAFLFLAATGSFLLTLPRRLWWLTATLLFFCICVRLLLRKGKALFAKPNEIRSGRVFPGRLNDVYEWLKLAQTSGYSRDKIRALCVGLAEDCIALKLDCPQEEARELFLTGTWTRDENLKTYFYKERKPETGFFSGLFRKRFRKSRDPDFLRETRIIINHLEHYKDETYAGTDNDLYASDHRTSGLQKHTNFR